MIRKARAKDIDKILDITKACAKHMINQNIYQWNEHYPNKNAFLNDLDRDELFVLEENNNVIGSLVISTLMDREYETINWLTPNTNSIYIHRLSVHPLFQNRGFAHKLMDFAEQFAIKNKHVSVRLDTFSKNQKNQHFYKKRGYQKLADIYFSKQSEHPFNCYELVL